MGEPPVSPAPGTAPRVLVAGVGNVLHADDGFGVRVVEALEGTSLPGEVVIREVGIGGIHLVQELMAGYDVLILVDTILVDDGPGPGEVQVRRMEVPALDELTADERKEIASDTHVVVPARVLLLASAVGVLPPRVFLVGCTAGRTDLGEGLTPPVEEAVAAAGTRIREILSGFAREGEVDRETKPSPDRIRIRDEILQVMYWMKGEGLQAEASPSELLRFVADGMGRGPLGDALEELVRSGLVEAVEKGRFRLTDEGSREGGRRFADEFHELTGQAHGECGDQTCDCHEDPDAALDCLAGRHPR